MFQFRAFFQSFASLFSAGTSRATAGARLAAVFLAAIVATCLCLAVIAPGTVRVSVSPTLLEGRTVPQLPDGYRLVSAKKPVTAQHRGLFSPGVVISDFLSVDPCHGEPEPDTETGAAGTDRQTGKQPTDRVVSRECLFPARTGGEPGRYDRILGAAAAETLGRIRAESGSDVGLSAAADIPAGEYALPTVDLSPNGEDYPFMLTRTARCSFRREKYRAELAPWLDALFPKPNDEPVVYVGAVGDMMLGRGVETALRSDGGIQKVFGDTLPVLRSCDLLIGNLEGTITGASAKAQKTYTFKFGKSVLPALHEAGFDYLMLTNNHSFDYGLAGFTDTLAAVRAAGFGTSGAGMNEAEAAEPWRTEIGGQRFSVLSCGAYPVENSGFDGKKTATATADSAGILWESERVNEIVRAEKASGAFVIVNVHGGQEYVRTPSAGQRRFYGSLCDSGADAVFGSHPHVLQPTEARGSGLIVYSLGNFVFPGMQGMSGAEESLIVRLGVYRNRIVSREEFPAKLSGTSVGLASGISGK